MSKKVFTRDGEYAEAETIYPYSNMTARKSVLAVGVLLCVGGFSLVLCALLMLFVPSLSYKGAAMTPLEFYIYLYGIGIALDFVGVVFTVAGANASKGFARLAFFMGSVSFIVGAVMLLIALFFKTVLPVDAINRMTSGIFQALL
jgi:hypothetical protein